jgi:transcriptional regulator with XRE-family HTH domain
MFSKIEVCKLVGSRIREARTIKGLTIEALALETNLEYSQLSRIELGKINTSIFHVYRIANCLQTPLADLFNDLYREGRITDESH